MAADDDFLHTLISAQSAYHDPKGARDLRGRRVVCWRKDRRRPLRCRVGAGCAPWVDGGRLLVRFADVPLVAGRPLDRRNPDGCGLRARGPMASALPNAGDLARCLADS